MQIQEYVSLDTVLKDTLDIVTNKCDSLGRETSKLVVQRRQKSLQNGDFCIPRGCFKMNSEVIKSDGLVIDCLTSHSKYFCTKDDGW
jgi:hypothetical protein